MGTKSFGQIDQEIGEIHRKIILDGAGTPADNIRLQELLTAWRNRMVHLPSVRRTGRV